MKTRRVSDAERSQVGWFGWAWVVGVSAYAVVRALVAWPTLGRYGVNPWVFLAIDLGTAPPYAYAQVQLIKSFGRREYGGVQVWTGIALVSFLAPYVYILIAGSDDLPPLGYAIVIALVLVFAAASLARFREAVRREQAADQPAPLG